MKHWPVETRRYSELDRASYAAMTRNGVNVCPEAWYLQRIGADRSAAGEQRLGAGTHAHQQIGRQTDSLRDLGNARRWLLVTITLLAALLLLQGVLGQQWMPHP